MTWLGVDVGGANIKVSSGSDSASSYPFELWKYPEKLADKLAGIVATSPNCHAVAATMTGELADCYESKAEGVAQITAALEQVSGERQLEIYCVDGVFRGPGDLLQVPLLAAASNWHALARFAANFAPSATGILVDIGSTTTDIIPFIEGKVASTSQTDVDRLLAGELVYSGVERTPICALASSLPYRGSDCPVAAELFATTADVYSLLGELHLDDSLPSSQATADGRLLTERYTIDRLARQVCADRDSFSFDDAKEASRYIRNKQLEALHKAFSRVIQRLPNRPVVAVVSGSGEFLARELAESHDAVGEIVSLSCKLGAKHSEAAAAHAVAKLAEEAFGE